MSASDLTPTTPVSVILPLFNPGRGLEDALKRLDAAVFEECEVIIIDDGSVDGTASEVRSLIAQRAGWRLVALEQNGGVAAARNAALRIASGEYVWFVDWDDEWTPSVLRSMYALARDTDADIVVSGAKWKTASGLELKRVESLGSRKVLTGEQAVDAVLLGELKGYLWSKLIRRELMPDPMFPAMRSQSDFCGLVPVLPRASKVVIDPEVRYFHVIREGSITNSKSPRLENLSACRGVVHETVESLPYDRKRRSRLRVYDYDFWLLSRANTALRLSAVARADAELGEVAAVMRWKEISLLLFSRPSVAVRSGLVKGLGTRYRSVWNGYTRLRGEIRNARVDGASARRVG